MRFSLSCLLALMMATWAIQAFAQKAADHNRFKWRDSAGNLHYGDALPADAVRFGYEVVNSQGIVVKRVERAKTAPELAAAKSAAASAKVERETAEAHARADEQLLIGYPEETDLKRAQRQKLEMLNQQVISAQISLRSQEQTLADLLGRAAEAERADKPLPEEQASQLALLRRQVDSQRMAVERRESELGAADARFEQEIARYRELKARRADASVPAH